MSKNNLHHAVHWIDGMKLSSMHFLQSDDFHTDQLQKSVQLLLNDYNYGLLQPLEGMRTSLDVDLNIHNDRVEIHLRNCNAITRGGVRILFQADNNAPLKAVANASDYENQEQIQLVVMLTSNPFARIPSGKPDPEESPLRHPYSEPSLRLEIIPASMVNLNFTKGNHLQIGSLLWKEKRFNWQEEYIPPCTSSAVHSTLAGLHKRFEELQLGLANHSTFIIRTSQRKETKGRPDFDRELAGNTGELCKEILRFLAESSFGFRNYAVQGPPILLAQQASSLAARLHTSLDLIPEDQAERLLAYFYQWTEVPSNQFRQSLSEIADLKYNHLDITGSIRPALRFLVLLEDLWRRLSQLKFIGQSKNSLVLGIESEYRSQNETSHSLLD